MTMWTPPSGEAENATSDGLLAANGLRNWRSCSDKNDQPPFGRLIV